MRVLTEGSSCSPSEKDPNSELDITMETPDSEQIQEKKKKKKVAYLRDTDVKLLLPVYFWLEEERHPIEATARQLLRRLQVDNWMEHNTPDQKHQIHLMDFRRYLISHGKADLAQDLESNRSNHIFLHRIFRGSFSRRMWFLNLDLSPQKHDEYQLLSLGYHPCYGLAAEEPISELLQLSFVGNPLKADIQYKDFFTRLSKELQWDDTEEEGAQKAIEIKDKYFPNMKDYVIPWALQDWANYITELYNYRKKIDKYCHIWFRFEKEEDYCKVLLDSINKSADPWIKHEFDDLEKYIERRTRKGGKRISDILIKNYFEVKKGEPKPDGGEYLLFVKEKIRMALKLGIIRKEDVEESEAGSQLLKDIERYNPNLFNCDDDL